MICEILGHFVNTLTADDKFSLPNIDNLPQPIQMQFSKKRIIFSQFFRPFLKSILIFEHFEKKMTLVAYVFPKIQTAKDVVRQMSKMTCFRTPLESQIVKGSQTLVKSA